MSAIDFEAYFNEKAEQQESLIPDPVFDELKVVNKHFKYPDGTLEMAPQEFIVLGSDRCNLLYPSVYSPGGEYTPPVCTAIGVAKSNDDLKPHESVKMPGAPDCKHCPFNQFGSIKLINPGATTQAKACKNNFRLVVVPAAQMDTPDPDIYVLMVNRQGEKNWAAYLNLLKSTLGSATPARAITKIDFSAMHAYPVAQFGFARKNDNLQGTYDAMQHCDLMLTAAPPTEPKDGFEIPPPLTDEEMEEARKAFFKGRRK